MRTIAIILVLASCASARPPDADEIARLVDQLGDGKFAVRETATARLREIGAAAIPALSVALASDSAERRRRADAILVEIDPIWRNAKNIRDPDAKRRRDAIKNVMGYRDPRVLDPVLAQIPIETDAECLRDLLGFVTHIRDRRATPIIAKCLLEPTRVQEQEVERVLLAIAALADPDSVPTLRKYCKRQMAQVPKAGDRPFTNYWNIHGVHPNVELAEAIGSIADPDCTLPLILMNSVSYDGHGGRVVQLAAVRAIVKIGPKAIPEILRQLELFDGNSGPHSSVRWVAVEVFGQLGDKKAVPALEKLLDNPVPWEAGQAAAALDRLGSDKGAEWVLGHLRPQGNAKPDPKVEPEALRALGSCKHPSLKEYSEQLLKTGEPWKRWHAAECLARMGEKAGFAFFHEQLKEEHSLQWAVDALIEMGDASCVPALIRWARHDGQIAVQASLPALAKFATPDAIQALIEMARGPELTRGYARTKSDAIRALGQVKSRKVVEVLMELLDDPDEGVRDRATGSLSEIVGVRIEGVARWKAWWAYHKDTISFAPKR